MIFNASQKICFIWRIFQAFAKKLRGSHGLHLWTDHSSIIQIGDMQEACPLISLAEDHCPLTYIREIRSSLPTQVPGTLAVMVVKI